MILGTFNGFSVEYNPETQMGDCKGVIFSLADAISVSKGGCQFGTAKHVEHINGFVKIDCLTDSLLVLKSLIKEANKNGIKTTSKKTGR